MGFKCGIVGLPNVGKSTLFNALTQAGIEAANFPFCTIEPNEGTVPVTDPRLEQLSAIVHPKRTVPTAMTFVDIAGLISGASKGEGLGNKFLANIRETDAIAHVVRAFDDPDIVHVTSQIDPVADMEVINTELALADLESVERQVQRLQRSIKGGDKEAKADLILLERLHSALEAGKFVRALCLDEQEKTRLKRFQLLTAKPMLYIANCSEIQLQKNAYLEKITTQAKREGSPVVQVCNQLEAEIAECDPADRALFLEELGLAEPGLNRVIRAGYALLNLQTYFTAGVKEVRAWTIAQGATAPQAAAVIHTDFARGFIRAEVVAFEDFLYYQGEQGAKEAGKFRVEGKNYVVKDGDVMHFRFNV